MIPYRGDFYNMACWNALSAAQQEELIHRGGLDFGYTPEGDECDQPASVAIETDRDAAPGPRFYCRPCAIAYLESDE